MKKPILWLGPVEEAEADYDPLLGRSAADLAPKRTSGSPVTIDPNRSVFDDPDTITSSEREHDARSGAVAHEQTVSVSGSLSAMDAALAPEVDTLERAPEPLGLQPDHNIAPENLNIEPVEETSDEAASVTGQSDWGTTLAPTETAELPANIGDTPLTADPLSEEPCQPVKPTLFDKFFAPTGAPSVPPAEPDDAPKINAIWTKIDGVFDDTPPPQDTTESPLAVLDPSAAIHEDTLEADGDSATPIEAEPAVDAMTTEGAPVDIAPLPVIPDDTNLDDTRNPNQLERILTPTGLRGAQAFDPEPGLKDVVRAPGDISPPARDFRAAFNADGFWQLPPAGPNDRDSQHSQKDAKPLISETADDNFATAPITTQIPPQSDVIGQGAHTNLPTDDLAAQLKAPAARPRTRRKKKVKKNFVGAFFGTFFFGIALIMTSASSLAPLGYPFDFVSSYRWYWVILGVAAAAIFGVSRGWKMVIASFALIGINLYVTVPASGNAPTGGKTATAVIGWANVVSNPKVFAKLFADADKKKVTLLMVAEAPNDALTAPAGWAMIEAPLADDPTAIAVYSKSNWRAVTVPGEPTMARPPAGDLTVIGVHPRDAQKNRRRTPLRDALINRAGTRAGSQDGPTIVVGDFNASPWDSSMQQFRKYGNVERVRCGGWMGTTVSQAFGLVGIATDHVYVRDVRVTHCQLGGAFQGGKHKPIWLYVAPQIPQPDEAQ